MKYIYSLFLIVLISVPCAGQDKEGSLTAGDVVTRIKAKLTCSWADETVDTYKSGGPESKVTGIACKGRQSRVVIW